MPFHYAQLGTFTAGLFGILLSPAAFPRVATEADVWAHFRVRKLSFRLLPTSPTTVGQAASFIGGIQDTNPSTYAQVTEILASCVKGVGQTTPSSWVHVQRSELAGPLPWYKSVAGTSDPTEESPGTISIVGTGTETFNIEFKGVFEFKTSVATGNTPLAIRLRELVRKERIEQAQRNERAVLLKILGTSSDTGTKLLP